jgi:hypothetical protein
MNNLFKVIFSIKNQLNLFDFFPIKSIRLGNQLLLMEILEKLDF